MSKFPIVGLSAPMADLLENASPVARLVYRLMKEKGLTQLGLAKAVGAGDGYFRDLFIGKSQKIGAQFIPKTAEVLGCSPSALLNPGATESDPSQDREIDEAEKIALLGFWSILSKEGKARIMKAIIREAGGTAPD